MNSVSVSGHGTLLVLPTYNEAESLPSLLQEIFEVLPQVEVLVVDDASPDGTGIWVEQRILEEPRLHVLPRAQKLGLGSAYRDAWQWAMQREFSSLLTMDADGSHPPGALPALLAPLLAGEADLVIGSRYVPGGSIRNWPLGRRFLSRLANASARFLLRLPVRDATAGYRAWTLPALRRLDPDRIHADGYSFLQESLWRALRLGIRVREIPITFVERRGGRSKISRLEILRGGVTLLRLLFCPPRRNS